MEIIDAANFRNPALAGRQQRFDSGRERRFDLYLAAAAIGIHPAGGFQNTCAMLLDLRNPRRGRQAGRGQVLETIEPLAVIGDAAQQIVYLYCWQEVAVAAPRRRICIALRTGTALRAVARDIVEAQAFQHELEGRYTRKHVLRDASRNDRISNAASDTIRVPPPVAVRYGREQEAVGRCLRAVVKLDPEAVRILVNSVAAIRQAAKRRALAVDPDLGKAAHWQIRQSDNLRQIGVRRVAILPPGIDEHERASRRGSTDNEGAGNIAAALQRAVDRECRVFWFACERLRKKA
ncbi:hypothetical protein D3C71_1444300 [compost metagenome]